MRLPENVDSQFARAFCTIGDQERCEIPAQFDRLERAGRSLLTLVVPGWLPAQETAKVTVYFGLDAQPAPVATAVTTSDGPSGTRWIENDQLRLLLGPEGAHVYSWQIKSLSWS